MTDKEKIILEHTRLALEYSNMKNSDNNKRREEIAQRVAELKEIEATWKGGSGCK